MGDEDKEAHGEEEEDEDDSSAEAESTPQPGTLSPGLLAAALQNQEVALGCRPEPPSKQPLLEDNTLGAAPQESEVEIWSEVPDVLPGVEPRRLHGKLGRFQNGSCCRIPPNPLERRQRDSARKEAHQGFSFNSRVSEALGVDRLQKDYRSDSCKAVVFPCTLPKASVVITFHNEHLVTLLRSVHSLLNTAQPHALAEVILVDDASEMDPLRFPTRQWERLQGELSDYVRALPKVRLVRLAERHGIMAARMKGARRARGEVLVFFDSHIEAYAGWLEPILAHIKQNRKAVVLPQMDVIDGDSFQHSSVPAVGPVSFTWTLGLHFFARPENDDIVDSPVVAGGHFAIDRGFFFYLGGYDDEMRFYGGEEVEMGLRTWMCGGSIKHMPCSRVGHVFRQGTWWQGQAYIVPVEEITRNKRRAAEVWMDSYNDLVRILSPLPPGISVGSVQDRVALREKLKCKPFAWYISNILKDLTIPVMNVARRSLALMNVLTGSCIDTLGKKGEGKNLGTYPCHPKPSAQSTQAVEMDTPSGGLIRVLGAGSLCIMAPSLKKVALASCLKDGTTEAAEQFWTWLPVLESTQNLGRLQVRSTHCLIPVTGAAQSTVGIERCSENVRQIWSWNQ